jgi:hypothetical protein
MSCDGIEEYILLQLPLAPPTTPTLEPLHLISAENFRAVFYSKVKLPFFFKSKALFALFYTRQTLMMI